MEFVPESWTLKLNIIWRKTTYHQRFSNFLGKIEVIKKIFLVFYLLSIFNCVSLFLLFWYFLDNFKSPLSFSLIKILDFGTTEKDVKILKSFGKKGDNLQQ